MNDDDIPERLWAAARSVSRGELPPGAQLRARVRARRLRRRVGFGACLVVVAVVVTTLALQLPGATRTQNVTVSQGKASTPLLPTTTPRRGSREKLVTSTLVLPSHVIKAGATLPAAIVIDNQTGHAILAVDCKVPFEVLLTNASHPGRPVVETCVHASTIPAGHSTFKVEIRARYNTCTEGSSTPSFPRCTSQGAPSLPVGRYQATTYELSHAIPVPPPQAVQVIP